MLFRDQRLVIGRFRDPVANSRLGDDDAWIAGIPLHFLSELADIDAEILRVVRVRRPPHGCQDLPVRNDFAGVSSEETTAAQIPSASALISEPRAHHTMAHAINDEIGRPKHRSFRFALDAVAKRGSHTRQKLSDAERLVDEIIPAKIECFNFFCFAIARRQNDDRHVQTIFAPPGSHPCRRRPAVQDRERQYQGCRPQCA